MKFLPYTGYSDHKPIAIIIDLEYFRWEKVGTKIFLKNKKFLERQSVILLERLYLADSIKETKAAFA